MIGYRVNHDGRAADIKNPVIALIFIKLRAQKVLVDKANMLCFHPGLFSLEHKVLLEIW